MNKQTEAGVAEGELLWTPSQDRIDAAQLTAFTKWLAAERALQFDGYMQLWQWSVDQPAEFWMALWDYFDVMSDARPTQVVADGPMFKAHWFEGARLNYAEHLLRHEAKAGVGEIALVHSTEIRPMQQMTWAELGGKTRQLATRLRAMGIGPGDRVVSYMPNVPETVIAMLATVAIGAIWSSAAPEFGAKTVTDRFGQIDPKLIFVADGYTFNGKHFDRHSEIQQIVDALPNLQSIVWLDYLGADKTLQTDVPVVDYTALFTGPDIPREGFKYERVGPQYPLWILFSSGTTGLPKPIVHGQVGMTLEHLKVMVLHNNLGPDKRLYFYTTTGWMMWNVVCASLISGASAVLYDGSPVYGGGESLWKMAAASECTAFGVSPTLVKNMKAAGIVPKDIVDLPHLDALIVGGAPSTPETFEWLYNAVKSDVWVTSQSGGTDMCSGIAGGSPQLPVHAAEIQCPLLGVKMAIWDDDGNPVIDEVGELVITAPFPSAPLYFWNDTDDVRYHDSYYSTYPDVWRHGDQAKITHDGGVYIYGRSDSTLNRYGVRIGSAEIYSVVEKIDGVVDSLVVCIETGDGEYYMPLYVHLQDGVDSAKVEAEITRNLRRDASPRHVPDEMIVAPAIPYTMTGKKMEIPVRKLLLGLPAHKVASKDVMAIPEMLDWYADAAKTARKAGKCGKPE